MTLSNLNRIHGTTGRVISQRSVRFSPHSDRSVMFRVRPKCFASGPKTTENKTDNIMVGEGLVD